MSMCARLSVSVCVPLCSAAAGHRDSAGAQWRLRDDQDHEPELLLGGWQVQGQDCRGGIGEMGHCTLYICLYRTVC